MPIAATELNRDFVVWDERMTGRQVMDAVAVRPGRGRLYVSVHDMYDAEKIGTIPGIEISVKQS